MSFLDTLGSRLFGFIPHKRTIIENDSSTTAYNFNVFSNLSHKYGSANVNHQMARDLYRNVNNSYALSAHLIRPIIDSVVSFIDTPTIRATNRRVLSALTSCQKRIDSRSVIRIAEREGTCFVWLQFDGTGVKYVVPRPETVKNIAIDPLTKEITGYSIEDVFSHYAVDGNEYQTTVKVLLTKDIMRTTVESTDPSVKTKTTSVTNVLGFIPIVRFTNDAEPWELRGHSELTVVEPTLKLYHDMLVDAANAQKQNSPKLKILTKSVKKFIENNFGVGMYERVLSGEGLDLDSRDVYLLERDAMGTGESDDLAYVSTSQATGDSKSLLEIAFMNAVEGSQVPELIFGASMGASLSSVQEQRPAFIKRIRRKQEQYAKSWRELFDMSLDILGYSTYAPYDKEAYSLDWEDPDFATDKEKADTANTFITGLVKARGNGILSDKEIHSTLLKRNFVEINSDFDAHIKELDETQKRKLKETEDVNAKKNDKVTDDYANGDYDNTVAEDVDKNTDASDVE